MNASAASAGRNHQTAPPKTDALPRTSATSESGQYAVGRRQDPGMLVHDREVPLRRCTESRTPRHSYPPLAASASSSRSTASELRLPTGKRRSWLIAVARPVVDVFRESVEDDAGDRDVRLLEHRLGAVQA